MGNVTGAKNSQVVQNANVDQTSGESQLSQSEVESQQLRPQDDPLGAAKMQHGLMQNASEYKSQGNLRGQYMREELSKRMAEGAGKPALLQGEATAQAAQAKGPAGLKPGEPISARVTQDKEGFHFEFQRPVTKEQAAAIIFQDGKVPKEAKLVPGKGNTWTVQMPRDAVASLDVATHFNAHRTQNIPVVYNPIAPSIPDPGQIYTWIGDATGKGIDKNPDGPPSIMGVDLRRRTPWGL